jgi:hypothetical protein
MRTIAAYLLLTTAAFAQAWTPPYCSGSNVALQYGQNGWICATITGVQGPAGPQGPIGPQGPQGAPGSAIPAAPPPSQCITSNWDGTTWVCVPTNYLTTDQPAPAPTTRRR